MDQASGVRVGDLLLELAVTGGIAQGGDIAQSPFPGDVA
jgi:hypothetical protein